MIENADFSDDLLEILCVELNRQFQKVSDLKNILF